MHWIAESRHSRWHWVVEQPASHSSRIAIHSAKQGLIWNTGAGSQIPMGSAGASSGKASSGALSVGAGVAAIMTSARRAKARAVGVFIFIAPFELSHFTTECELAAIRAGSVLLR